MKLVMTQRELDAEIRQRSQRPEDALELERDDEGRWTLLVSLNHRQCVIPVEIVNR